MTPDIARDTVQAVEIEEDIMRSVQPSKTLEDCIKNNNLFLIHIGHSWIIMRVTGEDSVIDGAIPLPELNKRFPKAAMINTIARFNEVPKLQEYLTALRIDKETFISMMNEPLDPSGYEEVTGRKQFM